MAVLSRLPKELLEEVVLHIVDEPFLGPPIALAPLLLVSRTITKILARKYNSHLYARICRKKFDVGAAVSRLGAGAARASVLADMLVRFCEALKRLRSNAYPRHAEGDALDGGLRLDLWMAYLMFTESDGRNGRQLLEYARIDSFALEFVRPGGRLHDGAEENEGWTVDNEVNALGVWLFWFTDGDRSREETPAEREGILGALGCFYTGSFKYASTHAPFTSFRIPPSTPPPLRQLHSSLSLSTLPDLPPCIIPDHFGYRLTVACPLATSPALLACLLRLGGCAGGIPTGSRAPATRADAIRLGWTGPTGEDYTAFGKQGTRGLEWAVEGSRAHEHDWIRLFTCYNPWSSRIIKNKVFTPGMLDGIWEGRWLAVPPDFFRGLLHAVQTHTPIATPLEPDVFQGPMRFRLREHHQYDRNMTLNFEDMSSDGIGKGALRAWLPDGTHMTEYQGQLRVYEPKMDKPSIYRTYDPVQATLDDELACHPGLFGGGIWDILLTAETDDDDFSAAWGHNRYVGRVRDWDGLVVLVQDSRPNAGQWVFRGYVHGSQNLVGRWRETGTSVKLAGWEGVWGMVKKHV